MTEYLLNAALVISQKKQHLFSHLQFIVWLSQAKFQKQITIFFFLMNNCDSGVSVLTRPTWR